VAERGQITQYRVPTHSKKKKNFIKLKYFGQFLKEYDYSSSYIYYYEINVWISQ